MDLQQITTLPALPERPPDAHKGTFGKVLLVAGSTGYSGAAILAGTAALRGGAGLVQVAVPESIGTIVALGQPCYMTAWLPADAQGRLALLSRSSLLTLADAASAVVAGPGLGQSADIGSLISMLMEEVSQPLLLDADALNVLGAEPVLLASRRAPLILTPHPGEFARLIASDTRIVQANRQELAVTFARKHRVILVLKGAGTIVTDGSRIHVNTTGNPGMATGGTGDVLSGLIGALLAQGMASFDAACLGVYLHGRAGDLASAHQGEVSLIATDLLDYLPQAIQERTA